MSKLSKVEDLNFLKTKTCVLKVNIHCEGCKKKVKKLLQKIDGVYTIAIDTEQGKVTVTGNVDPSTLIKKLRKSGKHAEIWAAKKNSNIESHHHLPKLPIDAAKGQKNSFNNSETKDQKMKILQEELMKMKLPFTKDEKSVKFSAPNQGFDSGNESDDSFDDEDDYFDETDVSVDETDDYKSDLKAMNSATKGIVIAKKGFDGDVHSKGNTGNTNGGGGTPHEAKNGSNKGNNNGDGNNNGHKQGNGGKNSSGLVGIPMAAGAVPAGYYNRGMAASAAPMATPVAGGPVNPHQQQYMTEMMQQQRMMMNGHPMAYGYPMPASNAYASYFSDENTSGSCRIM
ncbi:heavy metal-associated isoprenylated plant protein 32 [Dendrobium catenatum]|uniref:Heavy metal-associated isoprenylated plant protein 26 n=1 Tax=Dendrobium catenatum TaxID=906689 RepID=A0A2I0WQ57_9ASPA|nr:heavy metal-associated isoprenylated plant protein 32 [Dendrobium catenatum]PKU77795.1 Heavy metal-associated isoprenylated plant protein 26 [Dendrobium catenatum]